jgi:hypothetical protein
MLDLLLDKQNLFAVSLFPYLGFLWFLTKSGQTPKLALIGFYVLLVFVVITIPAGLYAQEVLGKELANVDVLHGGAEAFLTLSNILVVLGFRRAIKQLDEQPADAATDSPATESSATPQPDSPA